ncbi:MAG: cytochrome c biogenesis protein CcdA [Elusimicrobia bacterium]|nr:cytochrome c biogenesis protein CcdA [Elusimicrobiota bacterium]
MSYGTAWVAGVISFLSPCVLPLVPGYLSFVSGLSLDEISRGSDRKLVLKKVGIGAVSFVLGFSLIFVLLGASASFVGQLIANYLPVLNKLAGILIVLFGLHTLGLLPIKLLFYQKTFSASSAAPGVLGSFLMGLAFAFGWTPCIGPILAAILAVAATQGTVYQGMGLLAVYSLGLGIPFLLAGFGMNLFLQFFARFKRFIRWSEIAAGLLLVLIGVLMFSNKLTSLLRFVPEWFFKFSI